MKTIFNNKRNLALYTLFAVAILSYVALLVCRGLFHMNISLLLLTLSFICIIFFGSLIIQIRNGPPW